MSESEQRKMFQRTKRVKKERHCLRNREKEDEKEIEKVKRYLNGGRKSRDMQLYSVREKNKETD